ncbi:MAG: cytochrome b/b6 domain-containing protein [Pseudomonadota bacterium]
MKRHAASTRIWHWLNAVALAVLFMSGLGISNAHRHLYWGNFGYDPADAWLHIIRFPGWITLPSTYNLAASRDWHNIGAWVFGIALLCFWFAMLVNRHFTRDIVTGPRDWSPRHWWKVLRSNPRNHETLDGAKYNSIQKITYGVVLGILLPLMIASGLAISPGFEPAAPWLVDVFGGRQSARSVHFIVAWLLAGFFVLHIAMVLAAGAWGLVRDMITGGKVQTTKKGYFDA